MSHDRLIPFRSAPLRGLPSKAPGFAGGYPLSFAVSSLSPCLEGRGTPAYIDGMERTHSLTSFSDDELLRRLSDLLGQSRRNEADLVAHRRVMLRP